MARLVFASDDASLGLQLVAESKAPQVQKRMDDQRQEKLDRAKSVML